MANVRPESCRYCSLWHPTAFAAEQLSTSALGRKSRRHQERAERWGWSKVLLSPWCPPTGWWTLTGCLLISTAGTGRVDRLGIYSPQPSEKTVKFQWSGS